MNILLFVTGILMLLSILTATRIHNFLDETELKRHYRAFMLEKERVFLKKRSTDLYNSKTAKPSPDDPAEKRLNRHLNFSIFLDPQSEQDTRYYDLRNIATRLFTILTDSNELGIAIMEAINKAIKEEEYTPIAKMNKLAELQLTEHGDDDSVCRTFAFLLDGIGNRPLKEYIDVSKPDKNNKGISIYLARRELLLAIFDDPSFVNRIISVRNEIYRNYDNENADEYKKSAAFQLKTLVGPHPYENYLDFRISKTNPAS